MDWISPIRRRKIAGDLWDARVGVVIAALAVTFGALGAGFAGTNTVLVAILVLLALLGVGQAAAPVGSARAAERLLLRALGADDSAPGTLARLEGGLVGLLAAALAVVVDLIGGHSGWAIFWIIAAPGTGAAAAGRWR